MLYASYRKVKFVMIHTPRQIIQAALQGLPDAALDYGVLVYRGEGVQRDEAMKWHILAGRAGRPGAWLDGYASKLAPDQKKKAEAAVAAFVPRQKR
jgi:uncharacterized protein